MMVTTLNLFYAPLGAVVTRTSTDGSFTMTWVKREVEDYNPDMSTFRVSRWVRTDSQVTAHYTSDYLFRTLKRIGGTVTLWADDTAPAL